MPYRHYLCLVLVLGVVAAVPASVRADAPAAPEAAAPESGPLAAPRALLRARKYDEAIAALRKFLQDHPDDTQAPLARVRLAEALAANPKQDPSLAPLSSELAGKLLESAKGHLAAKTEKD